jgi:hypothetical protein
MEIPCSCLCHSVYISTSQTIQRVAIKFGMMVNTESGIPIPFLTKMMKRSKNRLRHFFLILATNLNFKAYKTVRTSVIPWWIFSLKRNIAWNWRIIKSVSSVFANHFFVVYMSSLFYSLTLLIFSWNLHSCLVRCIYSIDKIFTTPPPPTSGFAYYFWKSHAPPLLFTIY